jgi:hypothetical protein
MANYKLCCNEFLLEEKMKCKKEKTKNGCEKIFKKNEEAGVWIKKK